MKLEALVKEEFVDAIPYVEYDTKEQYNTKVNKFVKCAVQNIMNSDEIVKLKSDNSSLKFELAALEHMRIKDNQRFLDEIDKLKTLLNECPIPSIEVLSELAPYYYGDVKECKKWRDKLKKAIQ